MSQSEIIELLIKHPRLCEREIADIINKRSCSVSRQLKSMIKYKEVIASSPTQEDKDRIRSKFSNLKYRGNSLDKLKVFSIIEDDI